MSSAPARQFYTASGAPTAELVAQKIIEEHANPLSLAQLTIWVPNQRMSSALRQAFIKTGQPTLLPKIKPLVDTAPPPHHVLTPAARQALWLKNLIKNKPDTPLPQAISMVNSLLRLYQQLTQVGSTPHQLKNLVTDDSHAAHWQNNSQTLLTLWQQYEQWLHKNEQQDPTAYQRQWLLQQAEYYQYNSPIHPTWVVGVHDTTRPGQILLEAIAQHSNNTFVWANINTTELTQELAATAPAAPLQHLRHIINLTNAPEKLGPASNPHIPQLTICPDSATEATVLALQLRAAVAEEKTAALITSDRQLANQVQQELTQWNLRADDSAGQPFNTTPAGRLLKQLLELIQQQKQNGPEQLISLLNCWKHPWLELNLELKQRLSLEPWLRETGPKPLYQLSKMAPQPCRTAFVQLTSQLTPSKFPQSLSKWQQWLQALWQELIPTQTEALAMLWENYPDTHIELDFPTWYQWFNQLMQQTTTRQTGSIPGLYIWGPLEARLQQVDVRLIGGAINGVWPRTSSPNPWLNRAQRSQLGLPPDELQQGLNHHDWREVCAQPNTKITYSQLHHGTAATPSRWLHSTKTQMTDEWLAYAAQWRQQPLAPEKKAVQPAQFNLTAEQIPQRWSASFIAELMTCPYHAYLNRILRWQPWEPLVSPSHARTIGNALHNWLEQLYHTLPTEAWRNAEQINTALTNTLASALAPLPKLQQTLWEPRLQALIPTLATTFAQRAKQDITPQHAELALTATIENTTIYGRIDRTDNSPQGLSIIDYKTGQLNTIAELKTARAPQLAVLQWLAHHNNQTVAELALWGLADGTTLSQRTLNNPAELAELLAHTTTGLKRYINHFTNPQNPWMATGDDCRHCAATGINVEPLHAS